jgi:hypothetical protein
LMRKAAKQFISREAQIEPPLIECECEWAIEYRRKSQWSEDGVDNVL